LSVRPRRLPRIEERSDAVVQVCDTISANGATASVIEADVGRILFCITIVTEPEAEEDAD